MANSVDVLINIAQKVTGDNAVTELQRVEQAIKGEEAAIRNLEQWQKRMNQASVVDVGEYKRVSALIQEKKDKLAGLSGELVKLSEAKPPALDEALAPDKASAGVGDLGEALGKLGGPLGNAGNRAKGLTEGFSKLKQLGPAAIIGAVYVAAALVTVALIGAAIAAVKFAVGIANVRRNAQITLETMTGSAAAAKQLSSQFDQISDSTGVGADRLNELAKSLSDANTPASDLPDAIRAIATAEAALGDGAAAQKLYDSLRAAGKSASQAAAEIDAKFGGVVARRMLGTDQQIARLKSNVNVLFSGLDIEPVLKAMKLVLDLFSQSTSSGRALKFLVTAVMQPLVDGAEIAGPIVKRMFQGAIIAALQLYIAVKPVARSIAEFFNLKPGDGLETALTVGKVLFYALAAAAVVVAGSLALAALPFVIIGVAIWGVYQLGVLLVEGLAAIGGAAVDAGQALIDGIGAAWDWLTSIDLSGIAGDIIQGLADGITGAGGAVLKALTGVVGGAVDAAKSFLGIHSPSTLLHDEVGANMALGAAGGIDDTADEVQASLTRAVEPNLAGASSARASASGGGNVFHIYVDGSGAKDPEELGEIIKRKVAELFTGGALAMGAQLEPEAA